MIEERLREVANQIEESRRRRTRVDKEEPVQLVAVTKNHEVEAMRAAIDAGVTAIGENRVQEAAKKHETLERSVQWQLIGHLQTNKAKQAVKLFDLIQSIDSEHLLMAVQEAATRIHKVQDILIQVNLAREDSKFGVYKEDLPFLVQKACQMDHIRLSGLMCIAPAYEDIERCRPLFREMRDIFENLKMLPLMDDKMRWLSMGMTHDYQVAVEEGANLVRVGTAIFGSRHY